MSDDIVYAKLNNGNWGVRGRDLKEGALVGVMVDTEPFTETIDRVIWRGDDGVCLASIKFKKGCSSSWRMGDRNPGTKSGKFAVKMCLHCNLPFTFDECRDNGGSWKDDDCGCLK